MKLHITVGGEFDSAFDYDDDAEDGSELTPDEIKGLVTLWLMAVTDSVSVTQTVLDALADRLKRSRENLRSAVDAFPSQ